MGKRNFGLYTSMATVMLLSSGMTFVVTGCGKADSAASSSSTKITGKASLGPIGNATVELHCLNSDGSEDLAVLGSAVTNSDGNYTITLDSRPSCAIIASVSGGQYIEEATGNLVSLGSQEIHAVLPPLDVSEENLVISALTEMAYARFDALEDSYASLDAEDLGRLAALANAEVAAAAGLPDGLDITSVLPADPENPDSDPNSLANVYALYLAGLSELAAANGQNSLQAAATYGADFQDGDFDAGAWQNIDTYINSWIASGDNAGGFVSPNGSYMPNPIADPAIDYSDYPMPDTTPWEAPEGIDPNAYPSPNPSYSPYPGPSSSPSPLPSPSPSYTPPS